MQNKQYEFTATILRTAEEEIFFLKTDGLPEMYQDKFLFEIHGNLMPLFKDFYEVEDEIKMGVHTYYVTLCDNDEGFQFVLNNIEGGANMLFSKKFTQPERIEISENGRVFAFDKNGEQIPEIEMQNVLGIFMDFLNENGVSPKKTKVVTYFHKIRKELKPYWNTNSWSVRKK